MMPWIRPEVERRERKWSRWCFVWIWEKIQSRHEDVRGDCKRRRTTDNWLPDWPFRAVETRALAKLSSSSSSGLRWSGRGLTAIASNNVERHISATEWSETKVCSTCPQMWAVFALSSLFRRYEIRIGLLFWRISRKWLEINSSNC